MFKIILPCPIKINRSIKAVDRIYPTKHIIGDWYLIGNQPKEAKSILWWFTKLEH